MVEEEGEECHYNIIRSKAMARQMVGEEVNRLRRGKCNTSRSRVEGFDIGRLVMGNKCHGFDIQFSWALFMVLSFIFWMELSFVISIHENTLSAQLRILLQLYFTSYPSHGNFYNYYSPSIAYI
jgi:hypothetical protein